VSSIPKTMQAWVLPHWGDPTDLRLEMVAVPELAIGEVLVEVRASGLNFADSLMIAGRYQVKPALPFILGTELCGVVAVAPRGSKFRIGDHVAAQVWTGAYAQYCAVEERRLIRLPPNISFVEGAALPVSFTTAHIGLFRDSALTMGKTVLVHAAAGGIGTAATQLAKAAGAWVIATASTPHKLAVAESNGADVMINYSEPNWGDLLRAAAPEGVDVVVDPVGGEITLESLRHLAWRGKLLLVGFASGSPAKIPANRLLVRAATATGVYWNFESDGPLIHVVQLDLANRAAAGEIRPLVGARFGLRDYRTALRELGEGRTVGKVVLEH
jgi:NADPH:quinone reductase